MEGDQLAIRSGQYKKLFQSTPSAWRETEQVTDDRLSRNPISIHSLRMEGDFDRGVTSATVSHFNPLPPHGGRPSTVKIPSWRYEISIHSLRMEGDGNAADNPASERYFNPLPPHGGRLSAIDILVFPTEFQSTPSAWRETLNFGLGCDIIDISIHSLRMEGDGLEGKAFFMRFLFQSTPSAWRETFTISSV